MTREVFQRNIDLVYSSLLQAIQKTGAETVSQLPADYKLSAVYKIPLFGFRDDVTAQIISGDNGESILYIRSASRVGTSDYGVNKRRVKRILNKMVFE